MPRPRKTIEQLKASGTYRPSRHGAREQKAAAPNPVPALKPAKVRPIDPASPAAADDVRTERDRLEGIIGDRLSVLDGTMLDDLAERVVEVRRLREAVRSATPGAMEHTRISSALNNARTALDRLAVAFGLTPASRASLPEPPKPDRMAVLTRPRTNLDKLGA